jgi:hypothetical protein
VPAAAAAASPSSISAHSARCFVLDKETQETAMKIKTKVRAGRKCGFPIRDDRDF